MITKEFLFFKKIITVLNKKKKKEEIIFPFLEANFKIERNIDNMSDTVFDESPSFLDPPFER